MVSYNSERADMLAYLRQRRASCDVMIARSPEFADEARERGRQLDVMIDEVTAGLHVGAAAVEAEIAAQPPEGEPFDEVYTQLGES